ncbi:alcohol dehydrogenase 1 isoform X2 [Fundulus heteroclitus]|uniref:alcohol dehydrogenase 1 isoform X2 n=1 Tax=Fundulus heteroclitus TaxID=8078 RepID=UPI00165B4A5C|nr:alcohol dehydrogenase 1 isoform X2 [Fundulus heteroclitus]
MATAGKVIKCKAAVAWEFNQPLVIEEVEVAPPQEKEIRIKIVATGVCQSDLYFLLKCMNKAMFPAVLGHEAAGIVESVGPGVTEYQPGDKVIPLFMPQCRECRFCKSPKTNVCVNGIVARFDEKEFEASRISCKGRKLLQLAGTSTFSEYTVVKEIAVAKIDAAAPLDKVCLIGCAICTGYGAAVNAAKRSALESCVQGWGVSVIVGWTTLQNISAPPVQLLTGRTWKGTLFGGFKGKDGVSGMVKAYLDKKLMVDEFITHNMTLDQINEAVELMKHGQCIRTVLSVCSQ